jgi:hypothetical protein
VFRRMLEASSKRARSGAAGGAEVEGLQLGVMEGDDNRTFLTSGAPLSARVRAAAAAPPPPPPLRGCCCALRCCCAAAVLLLICPALLCAVSTLWTRRVLKGSRALPQPSALSPQPSAPSPLWPAAALCAPGPGRQPGQGLAGACLYPRPKRTTAQAVAPPSMQLLQACPPCALAHSRTRRLHVATCTPAPRTSLLHNCAPPFSRLLPPPLPPVRLGLRSCDCMQPSHRPSHRAGGRSLSAGRPHGSDGDRSALDDGRRRRRRR